MGFQLPDKACITTLVKIAPQNRFNAGVMIDPSEVVGPVAGCSSVRAACRRSGALLPTTPPTSCASRSMTSEVNLSGFPRPSVLLNSHAHL
jgi:hypothetical protein